MSENSSVTTSNAKHDPDTDQEWQLLANQLASGESQPLGFSADQFWERQRRNRHQVCQG